MTETYYPPVKFHFTASVLSSDSSAGTTLSGIDASFQEVSGIWARLGEKTASLLGNTNLTIAMRPFRRAAIVTLVR